MFFLVLVLVESILVFRHQRAVNEHVSRWRESSRTEDAFHLAHIERPSNCDFATVPRQFSHIATVPHSRLLVTQGETTIFSFSRHQRIAHAKPSSPEASTCCKATGTDVDLVWHSVEQDIAETGRSKIGRGTEVQGTWEAHKCIVRVLRRGGID